MEWRHKELCAEAKRVFGEKGRDDIKMVSVVPGLLTDLSVGPWFGMDCREERFEAIREWSRDVVTRVLGMLGRLWMCWRVWFPAMCRET